MTCDICGGRDILTKKSSFNFFFVCLKILTLFESIDKLHVKNFMRNYEKSIMKNGTINCKSKSWEAEQTF